MSWKNRLSCLARAIRDAVRKKVAALDQILRRPETSARLFDTAVSWPLLGHAFPVRLTREPCCPADVILPM